MRILFTTMPSTGHLRPLVPIAHAARQQGHEVLVATPASTAGQVEAYGLPHLPAGADWVAERLPGLRHRSSLPAGTRARMTSRLAAQAIAGPVTLRLARDVLAAAGSWRPDLVVRETCEFGGYLAAEVLGVPHVSVGAVGGKADRLGFRLASSLDVLRAELGLPADPAGARAYAYRHVSLVPEAYHPASVAVPRTRHYRQTSPLLPGDRLPEWLAGAPGPRPLVLAAFGTITPGLAAWQETLGAIVAGLGGLDCDAVVVLGDRSGAARRALGPPPANVRLVDWVPQPLVLECCDLFVTHGGFNSVREALRLGVPMVIVPLLTDQPANAARCAELGVAEAIDPDALTPAVLARAGAAVLADPAYRRRAAALQRRMLELPGVEVLVSDLAALATA